MIDIGAGHYIRVEQVKELKWDRMHYMNGTESTLVIEMFDGTEHRVKEPWALNVQRKILAELGRYR